ncbi:MAG: T9SS type A sorting domain-containing protein [Ignavibacteria bacterium]|nr:T9SS type A sorting domain-containing protein [Ignavibacteria bacterium]
MKNRSDYSGIKTFLLLLTLLYFGSSDNAKSLGIGFGPATYTNGSEIYTFTVGCDSLILLPSGGTISFEVYAFGSLIDFLELSVTPMLPGITFPIVIGPSIVHSTFTWVLSGSFAGTLGFHILPNSDPFCNVSFDWPLPVELASFTSVVHANDVTLNWTTATENNNAGFDIERKMKSDETSGWVVSGRVQGKRNSNVQNSYTFMDLNLNSGTYQYRLKQSDFNGSYEYFYLNNNVYIRVPEKFNLQQNYPNPFNPVTNVEFGISKSGVVSLKVHDMSGKEVATLVNENLPPGYYTVKFNGSNLSSGVYFCIMKVNGIIITSKMILMK